MQDKKRIFFSEKAITSGMVIHAGLFYVAAIREKSREKMTESLQSIQHSITVLILIKCHLC